MEPRYCIHSALQSRLSRYPVQSEQILPPYQWLMCLRDIQEEQVGIAAVRIVGGIVAGHDHRQILPARSHRGIERNLVPTGFTCPLLGQIALEDECARRLGRGAGVVGELQVTDRGVEGRIGSDRYRRHAPCRQDAFSPQDGGQPAGLQLFRCGDDAGIHDLRPGLLVRTRS